MFCLGIGRAHVYFLPKDHRCIHHLVALPHLDFTFCCGCLLSNWSLRKHAKHNQQTATNRRPFVGLEPCQIEARWTVLNLILISICVTVRPSQVCERSRTGLSDSLPDLTRTKVNGSQSFILRGKLLNGKTTRFNRYIPNANP